MHGTAEQDHGTGSIHLSTDDLADLHAGVLTDAVALAARNHLSGCPRCRTEFGELMVASAAVGDLLREVSEAPPMPAGVVARLDAALRVESQARQEIVGVASLGHARKRRRGVASRRLVLAAAGLTVALGGGAFVVDLASGPGEQSLTAESGGSAEDGEADNGAVAPSLESEDEGPLDANLPILSSAGFAGEVQTLVLSEVTGPRDAAEGDQLACLQAATNMPGMPFLVTEALLDGAPVLLAVVGEEGPEPQAGEPQMRPSMAFAVAGCDDANPTAASQPEVVDQAPVLTP